MAKKPSAAKRKAPRKKTTPRKWSLRVTRTSDALGLQSNIFKSNDASKIARSLKRSSERSNRRKGTPLQSAMSMLKFLH